SRYQACTRRSRSWKAAASTGRSHGSEEAWPQVWWAEVREGREQARRECDATTQAWYAQARQEWTWRQGEESQAGDRDWAIGGALIFELFGITLPAFRIAGGLILWLVAMDMLHAQRRTQESGPEIMEGEVKDDTALTPLAMPMLAGPGAISTVMVLAAQAHSLPQKLVVYASIVVTALASW